MLAHRYEPKNSGLLGKVHQVEDNLWMVMDRRTNTSRLLQSGDMSFVNNHFWNCYERNTGDPSTDGIVVDTVTATEDYLDTYFKHNLNQPTNWTKVFHKPQRCVIPFVGSSSKNKGEKGDEDSLKRIQCSDLLKGPDANTIFDYPTFNPDFKMNPDYRYTYAIAPQSLDSKYVVLVLSFVTLCSS